MFRIIKIALLVLCGNVNAEIIPEDGAAFNYTQLFFRWDQMSNAESYILTIQNSHNGEEIEISILQNSYLLTEFLDWNTTYTWFVCGAFADESDPFCSEILTFTVNSLPDYFPDSIEILNFDESLSQGGITLMDFESLNFSGGVDQNGNPIWFVKKEDFEQRFIFTQFLQNGNVVGFSPWGGYEIDLNGMIIFATPEGTNVHHQITKTTNNTYFIISATIENQYCPEECYDSLPDEIPWQGDIFREFDQDGNEIWNWNTFDYFDLTEYNPYYVEIYTGQEEMDWTHSNSVFFDKNSQSIFVSIRNLSRITKIDYASKDLIWSLGETDFMNEIYFEEELNFSQQHSVQVLENGNLLFFDNHRYLTPELSRCLEVSYDESDYSVEIEWEHPLPLELFTGSRGECDRLDNGNTLITAGRTGNTLEVTPNNEVVWQLKAENMGSAVNMYRSARIPNLHPIAFSVTIDELTGAINDSHVILANGSITANIHNSGWSDEWYTYTLQDLSNTQITSDSIFVQADVDMTMQIDVSSLPSAIYNLIIYPNIALEKLQSLTFILQNTLQGDVNNDGTIDILDIVNLVNLILSNDNSNAVADINQDGSQDILDIVILISMILEN